VFGNLSAEYADTWRRFEELSRQPTLGARFDAGRIFGEVLVGPQTFGLGVVYGMGENVVGSVVALAQLASTFLLADLYDRAHQPATNGLHRPARSLPAGAR
jgi:hypothetical protein